MSKGQRWNLATKLTAVGAELQAEVSSRESRRLSDSAVTHALELVADAQTKLGEAVAHLTTAPDEEGDGGT